MGFSSRHIQNGGFAGVKIRFYYFFINLYPNNDTLDGASVHHTHSSWWVQKAWNICNNIEWNERIFDQRKNNIDYWIEEICNLHMPRDQLVMTLSSKFIWTWIPGDHCKRRIFGVRANFSISLSKENKKGKEKKYKLRFCPKSAQTSFTEIYQHLSYEIPSY